MTPRLEELIALARARGPMAAEEIEAQKRSFIIGEAGFGSDADEAEFRAAVSSGDAAAIQRLEREALARMAAAEAILDARQKGNEHDRD